MAAHNTVLVTGASRGIGLSIADLYLANGWRVVKPTRSDLNLASTASVQTWLKQLEVQVDVLINNAGENPIVSIENLTTEVWERNIAVNLTSPMLLAQGLSTGMRKRGWGRIVNISSIFGLVSRAGRASYTTSKTGLIGFTRAAAVEWGVDGVLVNAVCPGYIDTGLTRKNNTDKEIEAMSNALPLRRLGRPEEIARAVYFLGSAENTFITGQTLVVDGGFTAQ